MAKRPGLTEESFLAHLFSPKKNALPTGLRARPIALSKGRKAARVNAYNKMPAIKQEVFKRSGLRDAYLRGEISFTDAKKALRGKAVEKGIVKPVRSRGKKAPVTPHRASVNGMVAQALLRTLRLAGKDPRVATVVAGSAFIQENDAVGLTYAQIKERASDPDFMMTVDGTSFNPYWYN